MCALKAKIGKMGLRPCFFDNKQEFEYEIPMGEAHIFNSCPLGHTSAPKALHSLSQSDKREFDDVKQF